MRFGLRTRVVTFILVVAVPMMAIQLAELGHDLGKARSDARDELTRTAQLAAAQHERALDTGLGVLLAVSRLARIEALSPEACRGVLAPILEGTPVLANVSAIRLDGQMYCSALPMAGPVSLSDREHFQEVLQTGAPATGLAIRTRLRDIPAFPIAHPVRDRDGVMVAVAAAVLRTSRLQRRLDALPLPTAADVVITDRAGTVVTARPSPEGRVGSVLAPELLAAATQEARTLERRGDDGVERVYGLAPVRAAGRIAMWAVASMPTAAIDAPTWSMARRNLAAFGAAWAVVLVAAIALADRFFVRRLRAMGRAAAGIASGAFATRTGIPRSGDELGELVGAFDEMAAALEALRSRNQLLLDSIGDGILGVDERCRVTFANPAAGRALGRAPEALVGLGFTAAVKGAEASPAGDCALAECLGRGLKQAVTSDVFSRADGTAFPVEFVSTPIVAGDAAAGAVVAFRDVTERRALEDRLVRAQKMEAVGQLAGGVAHDFNNVLTAIIGCARMLEESLPADHPGLAEVEEILASSDRAAQLTRQLLAFGRRQRLAPRPVDLRRLLAGVERMLCRVMEESIVLELRLPPGPVVVVADPGQLEIALLNLAVNARDAMPAGGRLTISLEVVDEATAGADPGLPPPPRAEIVVRDTGTGMDPETRERIFEPFFTTKPFGKGTGLGLPTVHGIVSQSGGAVRVQSAVGEGTEFRIILPLAGEEAVVTAPPPRREISGGNETILLVEDDRSLQQVAGRALRAAGYRVLEASRPSEALSHAAAFPVDLLVTDVVLPEASGTQLHDWLTSERPGLPTLLVSGYSGRPSAEPLPGGVPFLPKPFTPDDLLAAVRAALDDARRRS